MSLLTRRESFKLFLGGLLGTAGTVVIASSTLANRVVREESPKAIEEAGKDLEQRANRVAGSRPPSPNGEDQLASFLNGAFRNVGGGGGEFRNGGFLNGGGGGGFRNGGFVNGGGGGGGFRNGGFVNGGWRNY
jgi:hypothetical protein